MCVEYLENLLHEDSYNFDIPELEVRPDSVPVPEISEQIYVRINKMLIVILNFSL